MWLSRLFDFCFTTYKRTFKEDCEALPTKELPLMRMKNKREIQQANRMYEAQGEPLPVDEIEAPEYTCGSEYDNEWHIPLPKYLPRPCQRKGCDKLMLNPHYNRKYCKGTCDKIVNKAQVKEWDARRRRS